jgi:hypothetical protein
MFRFLSVFFCLDFVLILILEAVEKLFDRASSAVTFPDETPSGDKEKSRHVRSGLRDRRGIEIGNPKQQIRPCIIS